MIKNSFSRGIGLGRSVQQNNNMTTIIFKEWKFIADKVTTQEAYANMSMGRPDSCGCNLCKNFVNNRDNTYPNEIKILLNDLGVDFRKESEICHFYKQDNGLHLYSGWFHFKGRFEGKNCTVPSGVNGITFDLTPVSEHFSIGFRYDNDLSFFEDKENLVQIEFNASIPWTIDLALEWV